MIMGKNFYFCMWAAVSIAVLIMNVVFCEGKEANGWPQARSNETEEFKTKILELKNQRDQEIAFLIKQRNEQIQALSDRFRLSTQADIERIKKDKETIQQKTFRPQDVSKVQNELALQEEALQQKSVQFEQQINDITTQYEQQIQKIVQAYAQQFEFMRQLKATER